MIFTRGAVTAHIDPGTLVSFSKAGGGRGSKLMCCYLGLLKTVLKGRKGFQTQMIFIDHVRVKHFESLHHRVVLNIAVTTVCYLIKSFLKPTIFLLKLRLICYLWIFLPGPHRAFLQEGRFAGGTWKVLWCTRSTVSICIGFGWQTFGRGLQGSLPWEAARSFWDLLQP